MLHVGHREQKHVMQDVALLRPHALSIIQILQEACTQYIHMQARNTSAAPVQARNTSQQRPPGSVRKEHGIGARAPENLGCCVNTP